MSPEQHNTVKLDGNQRRYCDVWSYGICLWEMISCRIPFDTLSEEQLIRHIGNNCWNSNLENPYPFFRIVQRFEDVKEEMDQ
ncbi:hypothetical protein PENTCL1PPCAC_25561, partial [Pristionchus entomophagus]